MTISLLSHYDNNTRQYHLFSEDCMGCGRHSELVVPAVSYGHQVEIIWLLCPECRERMSDPQFKETVLSTVDHTIQYFESKVDNESN